MCRVNGNTNDNKRISVFMGIDIYNGRTIIKW